MLKSHVCDPLHCWTMTISLLLVLMVLCLDRESCMWSFTLLNNDYKLFVSVNGTLPWQRDERWCITFFCQVLKFPLIVVQSKFFTYYDRWCGKFDGLGM
jgi:hypothetical protein